MNSYKTLAILFLTIFSQIAYAQVDVTYNDLVWSDEFDENGELNSTKWHHQTQIPAGGNWYNGEVQHYTNRPINSFVENGVLKITAIREAFTDQGVTKQFTSARLNSKFAFTNGRVDIRAKIPVNQGTWPALWLLGKNITEAGAYFSEMFGTTPWPACGEIDMMEHGITPSQPEGFVQSAIHTPSSYGNTQNHGGTIADNLGSDFHVYSMNWSPNQINFLLDGIAFYTYNPPVKNASTWPFTADHYLLMNIAMGGVAGNIPENFTQATMEIDYVRVFQNTVGFEHISQQNDFHFQNPSNGILEIQSRTTIDKIEMYDINGRGVLETSQTNQPIFLHHLPRGIYFIRAYFNNKVSTKRVVLN